MTEQKVQSLNTQSVLSMRGAGYYSQRTAGAKDAIDSLRPLINTAIDQLADMPVLRFADFGAADGGTSAEMWHHVIASLRNKGDNRPVEILYTDLPSNDFSTLFKTMQGMQEQTDFAYQDKFENVFVHGCGTGFHRQLMASNSLSFGFSATAMHYVSAKPCEIADHVHMVGASKDERTAFAAQAAADWKRILLARATEMMDGGRLVVMNFGIDEHGRYLGNTGGQNMFDRFCHHWRQLMDDGIITRDEFIRASFAQHYRTIDEFTAPFATPDSAVSKAGLKLVSARTQLTKCPYRKAFEADDTMDAASFAGQLIPTTRSWSETVFSTALAGRPAAEITAIVDQFYGAYEAEIAASPDGHAMDYIHIIMEIEKQAG